MAEETPSTQAKQAQGQTSSIHIRKFKSNGVYHLLPNLDTVKGEKRSFHVNTPLKSMKTTYEIQDFRVFEEPPPQKKKTPAVYESAQCVLPTHWDV